MVGGEAEASIVVWFLQAGAGKGDQDKRTNERPDTLFCPAYETKKHVASAGYGPLHLAHV